VTPAGVLGASGVHPTLVVVVAVAAAALAAAVGAAVARRRWSRALAEGAAEAGVDMPADPELTPHSATLAFVRALAGARRSHDEVRATALLLEDALDGLSQGVVVIDGKGRVVHRNAAAGAFNAARHGDALIEAAIAELVAGALEGLPDRRELDLFGPPRRVVLVDVTPIVTSSGRAAVALIEDLTERRRLEAVRRDFVANVSHELKTPVGAIGLLAETLLGEDDPEVADRLIGRIQDESLRVGRTIEDLLELSRIETSPAGDADRAVVADVVTEAVSRIHPAAEHAGITIDTSAVDAELAVRVERRQLASAVGNLLDNAVKYSDRGSTVEVAAALRPDGQVVAVTVADHGIGIPARDLERIFERFYRVDQGRSRQTGGTGLGLAIVRHVAANHGGSVEVDSRLGQGSRFTLTLPVASAVGDPRHRPSQELVR
jgi:two-component system sensor histidine kinase SenX3